MATEQTIQRKVHFYRVTTYASADGTYPKFDARATCAALDNLPFDQAGRYLAIEADERLVAWNESTPTQSRIRFGKTRRSALPVLEEAGNTSSLDIREEAGLVETIHVVFFPNNVVGAEYNHFGPRINALARYLLDKCPDTPACTIDHLVDRAIQKHLEALGSITLLHFRMPPTQGEVFADVNDNARDMLNSANRIGDIETVEIILRAPRGQSLGDSMMRTVRRLVNSDAVRDAADLLKVKGRSTQTGNMQEVNLLQEFLLETCTVVRHGPRTRHVDSTRMYEAINEAYEKHRDDIANAVAMDIDRGNQE